MTFHVAGYTADVVTATLTTLTPITDQILNIQNGRFLPREDLDLIFAASMATDIQRSRLLNPSTRQITNPYIRPLINASVPPNDPSVADYRDNPFTIKGVEELEADSYNDAAVGPERTTTVIGLRKQYVMPNRGDIYTMRGTGATALTANVWTDVPITWADTLPVGNYDILGLVGISANCQAARLILGGQEYRPGSIGSTDVSNRTHEMFRRGRLGVWGRFNTIDLPQVQFLANAADATQEVYLDIMRVG